MYNLVKLISLSLSLSLPLPAAKAPPHEINNFWEELQLMKSIPPHGNIVNLLGYCTTPGMQRMQLMTGGSCNNAIY